MVPRLVTLEIDPAASRGALQGVLSDLVDRMRGAQPPEVAVPKAEWLEARSKMTMSTEVEATKAAASATTGQSSSALIPREVPALPKGNLPRRAIISGI